MGVLRGQTSRSHRLHNARSSSGYYPIYSVQLVSVFEDKGVSVVLLIYQFSDYFIAEITRRLDTNCC